jgi:CheY-like chemotaxis protein/nitrogen-specific signal transduction histidine kinase
MSASLDEPPPATTTRAVVIPTQTSVCAASALHTLERSGPLDGSDLLITASHEIRTPMYGLLGMLDIALASELTATQRHYMTLARASAASLATLVNDLLDLSKLQSGHFSVTSAECDLHRLLDESLGTFSVRAAARNIEFSLSCDADLPQRIEIDATRLLQVLSNLVGNAIKFTSAGRVSVTVATESIGGVNHLRVSVRDTGPGIAPADLERIFRPFAQFHGATSGAVPNTGLGLTITRSIVAAMGGHVIVSSELGVGSCFEAVLPAPLLGNAAARPPLGDTVCLCVQDAVEREQLTQWLAAMGCLCVDPDQAELADAVVCDASEPIARQSRLPKVVLVAPSGAGTSSLDTAAVGSQTACAYKPLSPWRLQGLLAGVLGREDSQRGPRAESSLWHRLAGARVLLVDDDAVSALVSQSMLEMIGIRVTTSACAQEATAALTNEAFDVVLTDLRLPGMDGYELARWIRDFQDDCPPRRKSIVIALSASTASAARQHCLDVGMDDFVAKPVLREQLYAVLLKHAEKRGPQSPARYFVNTTYG